MLVKLVDHMMPNDRWECNHNCVYKYFIGFNDNKTGKLCQYFNSKSFTYTLIIICDLPVLSNNLIITHIKHMV